MAYSSLKTSPGFDFKISRYGRSPQKFRAYINSIRPKIMRKAELIGIRIADHMSMVINRDRVRKGTTSSGGLASAFRDREAVKIVFTGSMIHIGIGDKRVLNNKYPYWKIVNKGGFVPSPTFGFFGHGGGGGRPDSAYAGTGVGKQLWHRKTWTPGTSGVFLMVPKNPIPAMNYIGKTSTWARRQWSTRWKREIQETIKRKR